MIQIDYKSEIKKYSPFILVLVIIILFALVVHFLNENINNSNKSLTSTNFTKSVIVSYQPKIDISGWQTYKNQKYGFEIKYPESIAGIDFSLSKEEQLMNHNYDKVLGTLGFLLHSDTFTYNDPPGGEKCDINGQVVHAGYKAYAFNINFDLKELKTIKRADNYLFKTSIDSAPYEYDGLSDIWYGKNIEGEEKISWDQVLFRFSGSASEDLPLIKTKGGLLAYPYVIVRSSYDGCKQNYVYDYGYRIFDKHRGIYLAISSLDLEPNVNIPDDVRSRMVSMYKNIKPTLVEIVRSYN